MSVWNDVLKLTRVQQQFDSFFWRQSKLNEWCKLAKTSRSFCFVRSECWLYTRGFTALLHTLHHSLPHKSQSDTAGDCATAQSSFCIRNTAGHKARNLLWGCQLNTIKMGVSAACCLPPPTVTFMEENKENFLILNTQKWSCNVNNTERLLMTPSTGRAGSSFHETQYLVLCGFQPHLHWMFLLSS